jgi:p24 family protein beta-1
VSFNVYGVVYVASTPDSDPLDKEVRTLGELLRQVKDEQEYLKTRERTHRNSTHPVYSVDFSRGEYECEG